VELAPAVLPPLRHVGRVDDVEAERRLLAVYRECAVELLDALRVDVQEERKLRLAAHNDVSLQCLLPPAPAKPAPRPRELRQAYGHRNALFSFSKKPSSAL